MDTIHQFHLPPHHSLPGHLNFPCLIQFQFLHHHHLFHLLLLAQECCSPCYKLVWASHIHHPLDLWEHKATSSELHHRKSPFLWNEL